MKQLVYNSSFFTLLFIALTSVTLIFCDWMKRAPNQAFIKIDGDGKDYYSYLTSAFITKDLAHLKPDNNFVVETPTGNINMHPVGVAVLQLPFFGLGYLIASISHQPLNGYSLPFQLAISLAALFYALTGFFFIYKTLTHMTFGKGVIMLSILCLFFGTTLLNYTVTEPSMSHIYSFALISAFMYYNHKLAHQFSVRSVYILALVFGLIILVRPVNALVLLLVPVFYNSFGDLKSHFRRLISSKKVLLLALLILMLVFSIQCLIWFIQTGHIFQSGYKGNGFYFLHPQLIPMLFGFNSGIFIYTPLFFIVSVSFFLLYTLNKFKAISLAIFSGLALYIFSSYWGWTYFDGIGTRTIVDFYALVAIALAYVFSSLNSLSKKWATGLAVSACVLFNLVICYQYKEGIIQSAGMNFEKFKYVFLKTSSKYKNVLGGCYDLQPYSAETKQPFATYSNNFDNEKTHFYNYNKTEYGVGYRSDGLQIDSRKMHVKIGLERLDLKQNATQDVVVTLSLNDHNNNCKSWQTFKLNDVPSLTGYTNWKHYNYGVNIVADIKPTDQLIVAIWNKEKQQFGIDNFKIELYDYGHVN